jgi:thymidylate kinase
MDLTTIVDRAITRPALVFGSIPPAGRDLDLLVRERERAALQAALSEEGFEQAGHAWVRFAAERVDAIDVVPADHWALPTREVEALFADAIALGDSGRLVRPAPHHLLLILARRVVRDGLLEEKRRHRVAEALREDPGAWAAAESRAHAWGGVRSLAALKNAFEGKGSLPAPVRSAALEEELRARDTGALKAKARAWTRSMPTRRRGHIVTFSGLDGSGKSTQANRLRDALEALGYEPVIEWTKIARSSLLALAGRPIQALLKLRRSKSTESERTIMTGDGPIVLEAEQAAAKDLRRKSRVLTHAWTMLVAVSSALDHRRATSRHLRAGRIVISDRYTLDTAAHLRYRYGVEKTFRVQSALNRVLSPTPVASYFLDVSPRAAYERKAEQYEVEDLEVLRRLYLEEARRGRVRVVSGEQPLDELAGWLARDVWRTIAR